MPTVIGALVAQGLDFSHASGLGATELVASAFSVLVAPVLLSQVSSRMLARLSLAFVVAGQIATLAVSGFAALLMCRVAAGAGEGLIYAVAIASLSASKAPGRALGLSIAFNQTSGMLLLVLIPWVARSAPASASMILIGGFAALHLPLSAALPRTSGRGALPPPARVRLRLVPAGLSMLAMFALSAGFGVVWPLIGRIGALQHASSGQVGLALAMSGIGGVVGATLTAAVAPRLGSARGVFVGTAGLAFSMLLLRLSAFVPGAAALMVFWTFSVPFYLSIPSKLDATGRLSVFTSAMIAFGIAAGQLAGGPLSGSRTEIVYAGLAAFACALAAALATVRISRDEKTSGIRRFHGAEVEQPKLESS